MGREMNLGLQFDCRQASQHANHWRKATSWLLPPRRGYHGSTYCAQ